MNQDIERIVKDLKVHEKKENLIYERKKIYKNEREIARLVLNYNTGKMAHALDEYYYLCNILAKNQKDKIRIKKRLSELKKEINELGYFPEINHYLDLRTENAISKLNLDEYYKTINISLRYQLKQLELPDIYVYNGGCYKHIIDGKIKNELEDQSITVFPYYDISSKRDLRHFYNKLSFQYLENMTNDYSFDIEDKDLGKTRLMKVLK